MKSKFEMFKENYHKPSPSDVRYDQPFVNIDNTQSKSERSKSAARHEHK